MKQLLPILGLASSLFALENWQWQSHDPLGNTLTDIHWDGTQAIAVGGGGAIMRSTDLDIWEACSSGTSNHLYKVEKFNETYIASGERGTILTSTDGLGWQTMQHDALEGVFGRLFAIASNDTIAVVTGEYGAMFTSANGSDWEFHGALLNYKSNSIKDIVWADTIFHAVGLNRYTYSSYDGTTWTKGAYDKGYRNQDAITYDGANFVTAGFGFSTYKSADGVTMDTSNAGRNGKLNDIHFADGQYVAAGSNTGSTGCLLRSTDRTLWDTIKVEGSQQFTSITHTGTEWLIGSAFGQIYRSSDLETFTALHDVPPITNNAINYNGDHFLIAADDGQVLRSENGLNWDTTSVTGYDNMLNAHWSGEAWIVAGKGGKVFTSADGKAWTKQYPGARAAINKIVNTETGILAFCDATFGDRAKIYRASKSGENWELVHSFDSNNELISGATDGAVTLGICGWGDLWYHAGTPESAWVKSESAVIIDNVNDALYYMDQFYLVGDSGMVYRSGDGAQWEAFTTPTTHDLDGIKNINGTLYAFGDNGTLLSSADGATWVEELSVKGLLVTDLATNGKGWLAVSYGGAIVQSGEFQKVGVLAQSGSRASGLRVEQRSGAIRLSLPEGRPITAVKLYNLKGQELRSLTLDGVANYTLPTTALSAGRYLVTLGSDNGLTTTQIVVKY